MNNSAKPPEFLPSFKVEYTCQPGQTYVVVVGEYGQAEVSCYEGRGDTLGIAGSFHRCPELLDVSRVEFSTHRFPSTISRWP